MKKLLFLSLLFTSLFGSAQDKTCGTVIPDVDPLEGISFKTMDDDQLYEFRYYVTVLYVNPSDTVKLNRAWLRQEMNIVNTYFRLLNTDIIQVPQEFRGLAADMKVQFVWAGARYVQSGNTAFPSFMSFTDPAQGGIPAHNPQNTINYYYAPYTWSTGVAILPNSGTVGQPHHIAVTQLNAALQNVSNHYTAWVNVHELGHILNLLHTFQGGCQVGDCLLVGDRVCDTPPCTQGSGCINLSSGCGTATANRHNHMDYSDRITCAKMFTAGQKERGRTAILAFFRNHIVGTTPPNQPPTCRITRPTKDTTVVPNALVIVTVAATDDSRVNFVDLHFEVQNVNNLVEIMILNDKMQVITDTSNYGGVFYRFTNPPYSIGLRPQVPNKYIFHAHATDDSGMVTTSNEVAIIVNNAPPPVSDSPIKLPIIHKADGSLEFTSEDGRKKRIP